MATTSSYSLEWLLGSQNSGLDVLSLEQIELQERQFEGGDVYLGGWRDGKPEGEGRYTWKNGAEFSGSWASGMRQGWGKYIWANGSIFLGEWKADHIHGYGTFTSPDGSRYQGFWMSNMYHGFGTKWYSNGDRREGLWAHGAANGPGRYVWVQGTQEFDGEWKDDKMHGRGTMKWESGHRYDGNFVDGLEEGIGIFSWPDGSTYEGFWRNGHKDGVGVFRSYQAAHKGGGGGGGGSKGGLNVRGQHTAANPTGVLLGRPPDAALAGLTGATSPAVYICEYSNGSLILEEALSLEDLEHILGFPSAKLGQRAAAARRKGLRRNQRRVQNRLGQTIYKGSPSFDLMLDLQLGIRYTLGTLSKLPPPTALLPIYFEQKVWLRFPREGSEVTPPHPTRDFKWKDYAPVAFRHLRGVFGIENSDYILSLCSDRALRELSSPGKSGSVFWVSQDEKFMVKTMRKEEIRLLLRALPHYCAHVIANPGTLITRFYGVHRVTPAFGRKVRFVVMNNIFRTDLPIHKKFDLKGSTFKRSAAAAPSSSFSSERKNAGGGDGSPSFATTVLKDLDLDSHFRLSAASRRRLLAQLAQDCTFLEEENVMDYSLLLGVHFKGLDDDPIQMQSVALDGDFDNPEGAGNGKRDTSCSKENLVLPVESAETSYYPHDHDELGSTLEVYLTGKDERAPASAQKTDPGRRSSRSFFSVGRFLAWRREVEEKRLQKVNQDLGIRQRGHQPSTEEGGEGEVPQGQNTSQGQNTNTEGEPGSSLPLQNPSVTGPITPPKDRSAGTEWSKSASLRTPETVTYNQQLIWQHAALVAALNATTSSRPSSPLTRRGVGRTGFDDADPTTPGSNAADAVPWRVEAAVLPEDATSKLSLGFVDPPNTPAGVITGTAAAHARAFAPESPRVRRAISGTIEYPSVSPPLAFLAADNRSSTGSEDSQGDAPAVTLATQQHIEKLKREIKSTSTGNLRRHHRSRSDPTTSVTSTGEGVGAETSGFRSDPSWVDLEAPEAVAMISRISRRLSRPLSDRVIQDLLRLARHRMLGPVGVDGRGGRERVPADVLAANQSPQQGSGGLHASDLDEQVLLTSGILHDEGRNQTKDTHTFVAQVVPALRQSHIHPDGDGTSNPTVPVPKRPGSPSSDGGSGDEAILYVGLIDWLQPYNVRKKVERSVKAMVQDPKGISVQEPKAYAKRFLGFVEKIFLGDSQQGGGAGGSSS